MKNIDKSQRSLQISGNNCNSDEEGQTVPIETKIITKYTQIEAMWALELKVWKKCSLTSGSIPILKKHRGNVLVTGGRRGVTTINPPWGRVFTR